MDNYLESVTLGDGIEVWIMSLVIGLTWSELNNINNYTITVPGDETI